MTAVDTSAEAVERVASIIVKPLSTLKDGAEAAALLRALAKERDQLREAQQRQDAMVRLTWSDRECTVHPDDFWQTVMSCALDHSYDRGDGIPDGLPSEYADAFAPVIERHLSAVDPEWADKTVSLTHEQYMAFEADMHAAQLSMVHP
jgi:hypothetical protein